MFHIESIAATQKVGSVLGCTVGKRNEALVFTLSDDLRIKRTNRNKVTRTVLGIINTD